MSRVVVAEKGMIKRAKKKELEAAGIVVVEVEDIAKVKLLEHDHIPVPPLLAEEQDDGFRLNA